MGRLTFPRGSRLYLDTSPIIYAIEEHVVYWQYLLPIWAAFEAGEVEVVTSEMSLLETLVHPIRNNNLALVSTYTELLTGGDVLLFPISMSIVRAAAVFGD